MQSMNKKRFSIIIPAYNAEKEIERALESVKKQTFKNYEIIVVDDCSTDSTNDILRKRDDIILISNKVNSRAGASRNNGLDKATGEYIIFLDSDDYLAADNTLESIDEIIANDVPDVVYLGFQIIGRLEETWIPTVENSTLSERARNWKYENVWDVCWNREFIKNQNLRFVENKYFEDFVFYYKGIMNAKSYKVASFITHIYTMFKDTSMTALINEVKLQDLYYNVNDFLEALKSVEEDKKADIVYAIYRVVEYSTRLLKEYEKDLKEKYSKKSNFTEEQITKKSYLLKRYSNLIQKYKNVNCEDSKKVKSNKIWICWWQGLKNAPTIVKKCVENVKRYAKNKEIIIVDKDNYKEYVDIPDYIIDKLESKKISITHFSDVLRINILNTHGGLWMDATCYVTSEGFIPENTDFYTIKLPYNENEPCISEGKWCVFFLYGLKGNILFKFMKEFYDEYWKLEEKVIDYYVMDYMIQIAYENIPAIKKMIDNVPESNPRIHDLKNKLNEEYNETEYMKLTKENSIHKLAHEKKYITNLEDGNMTFYGYILNS